MFTRMLQTLRLFAAFAVLSALLLSPVPAKAMSEFFPVTRQQVIEQWQVSYDPADPCFDVVKDGDGWEIWGTWFDVKVGSQHLALTLDLNRNKYRFTGAHPQAYGLTPGGGTGERFVVAPGQEIGIWSTGGCGFGMTIWPGVPQQPLQGAAGPVPVVSAPAPSAPAPIATPVVNVPGCEIFTSAEAIAAKVGGDARYWSVLPNTNSTGWKYNAPGPAMLTVLPSHKIDRDGPTATSPGETVHVSEATDWALCNP